MKSQDFLNNRDWKNTSVFLKVKNYLKNKQSFSSLYFDFLYFMYCYFTLLFLCIMLIFCIVFFTENLITDKTLLLLSRDDLKDLVPVIGDRAQIMEGIRLLKAGKVFVCFQCNQGFINLQDLLNHFKNIHRLNSLSMYRCSHCNSSFNRKAFIRHCKNVYKFHKSLIRCRVDNDLGLNVNLVNETVLESVEKIDDDVGEQNNNLELFLSKIQAALFSSGKVPISTADKIFVSIKQFTTELLVQVNSVVKKTVKTTMSDFDKIIQISKECGTFLEIFSPFQTKYKLDKFMLKNNLVIPAKEIVLDSDISFNQGRTSGPRQVYKNITMQYVSIKSSILQLLNKPGFYSFLSNTACHNGDNFTSFREGKLVQQFSNLKNIIFINVYYDDAEMANPLGSKSGKHKLSNFYFTISDMPQHMHSSIKNIILLASLKSEDFKSSSPNAVMKIMVDELQELWTHGIDFQYQGKTVNVKVCLSQLCGDNLGLHTLLGFSEGFTANYPCRRCKMHKKDCQKAIVEDFTKLRNANNYEEDLVISNLSRTGISHRSVLNNLPYFHVTQNFVFDIMHDLLEGVAPDFILHFLNFCISKKYFNLDTFNYRLESFDYGRHFKSSKPSLIKPQYLKKDGKIGQNASQSLCLTLCLPLIVGDLVPSSDETWDLMQVLRDILFISLANKITKGGLIYFDIIVSEYLLKYQRLFKKHLKPKHHHLVHYSSAIEQIGPLKPFWSMTFESKHKFFKTTSHAAGNYKNISKSLCYRHQLARGFDLLSMDNFTPSIFEVPSYEYNVISTFDHAKLISDFLTKNLDDKIRVSGMVVHNGCEYRIGSYVLLEYCSHNPVFGQVQAIILEDDDCNFLVKVVHSSNDAQLNCFKLIFIDEYKIVDVNSIQFYLPLYTMSSFKFNDNDSYIALPVKYV